MVSSSCIPHDYLRAESEIEYFTVWRTALLASPADAITVYAAQGNTYYAVIADMQKLPNHNPAQYWLACYVMLSRARSLDGLLIPRPATRKELSAKPPKYLPDEIERLQHLERTSLQEIVVYIESLPCDAPPQILEIFSADVAREENVEVATCRGQQPAATFDAPKSRLLKKASSAMTPSQNETGVRVVAKQVRLESETSGSTNAFAFRDSASFGSKRIRAADKPLL